MDAVACLCYAPAMAVPLHRKIGHWIFDHLLWDPAGTARAGFRRGLWATRKLLVILAGTVALTWAEWVEHHPPEIAIVALIHLVFVFAAVALLVYVGQWFRDRKSPSNQAKGL